MKCLDPAEGCVLEDPGTRKLGVVFLWTLGQGSWVL